MATLDAIIDSCLFDYLLTGQREARNVLATTVNTSVTSVVLTYTVKGAQEGARVSLDFEDMYVVDSNAGTKTLTVIRGQYGTTAAAHTQATCTVWVNPKWSRAQVLRAVNAELDALSGLGLYQMATVDVTFSSPVSGYDLTGVTPDDLIDIYQIRANHPGPSQSWPPIDHFTLLREADATDFPSGLGLVLHQPGHPGLAVRVQYKKRFAQVTSADAATDLSTSAGIDREAHDLVAIGAAIRLTAGTEVRRSQLNAQPDPRRSEEVPPGAAGGASKWLRQLYEDRLMQEKSRLARRYPPRKAVLA